jgi:hypothetical protein
MNDTDLLMAEYRRAAADALSAAARGECYICESAPPNSDRIEGACQDCAAFELDCVDCGASEGVRRGWCEPCEREYYR